MTALQARTEFRTLLRAAMQAQGLTQRHVATLTGVDQTAVSRWVNARAMPEAPTLATLAGKLGLDYDRLMELKMATLNDAQPRGRKRATQPTDEPRIDEMAAAAGLGAVSADEEKILIDAVRRVQRARERATPPR